MLTKRDAAYWKAIKPQTTLTLTDAQALRESVDGQEYLVDRITKLKELNDACEWLLFTLIGVDGAPDSTLMVKIAGKEIAIRVYFESSDFQPGNRQDMVDQSNLWLFQKPKDPEHFLCSQLKYSKHVGWDFPGDEEGDSPIHVDYNVKVGEMQCSVAYEPHEIGQNSLLATMVEFDTSDKTTCPEMFLLEIGNVKNRHGGLIRMMFGNCIRSTEVDVLAVTA